MNGTPRPRVAATIEARMAATRLPGKVMLPVAGKTMLERMIERVKRATLVDDVVVATTVNPPDRVIADLCERIGCAVHRGPENDITERLIGAVERVGADVLVQLTGDCPLVDPEHIDRTVTLLLEGGYDYVGNNLTQSFPIGFDVRALKVTALKAAYEASDDPIDRVHGSYFLHRHPDLFRHGEWQAEGEMRWPELRLTVDDPLDYEVVRRVFETLLPVAPHFTAAEVVALMRQQPDWCALNAGVRQKAASEG